MGWIYALAVWCNDFLLWRIIGIKLQIEGLKTHYPNQFYIIIANHQSWNDIFVLQHLFNRRAPVLKFLVKRELFFLPIVGLICWAYDYPFLRRDSIKGRKSDNKQSRKDAFTLVKSLHSFISYPASIINLVEGTRFSQDKARGQKSPYDHLLKPKAGGLTTILDIMGDRVKTIIDVTIIYDCRKLSLWNLLCGKCKSIYVRIEEYAIKDIDRYNTFEAIDTWVKNIWEKKELVIHTMKQRLG